MGKKIFLYLIIFLISILNAENPKGIILNWDFRNNKNLIIEEKNNVIPLKSKTSNKIYSNCFKSISCHANAKVKLKIQAMGQGILSMGCHAYDSKNRHIISTGGQTIKLLPEK